MKCPQCGGELQRVRQESPRMLNDYQFDAVKAGDWYCESCPPNGRSALNKYAYFWQHEVEPAQSPVVSSEGTAGLVERLRAERAKHRRLISAVGDTLADGLVELNECVECSTSPCPVTYPCDLSRLLDEAISALSASRSLSESAEPVQREILTRVPHDWTAKLDTIRGELTTGHAEGCAGTWDTEGEWDGCNCGHDDARQFLDEIDEALYVFENAEPESLSEKPVIPREVVLGQAEVGYNNDFRPGYNVEVNVLRPNQNAIGIRVHLVKADAVQLSEAVSIETSPKKEEERNG